MSLAREWKARRKSQSLTSTDPVTFAIEALGIQPWGRQKEILDAVNEHPRVAVRSGHKVAKTNSAAILALWFFYTRDLARVIMTATTNSQIRNVLWREIRIRAARAKILFPSVPELPNIGMRSEDGTKEIIGLSTNEAERMAGFSSPNMMFIIDEASGVPASIFEAIEGNRAGGARIVMFSNPTQPSGEFFDAFHSKSSFWHTMHISSREAAAHDPSIPGLATLDWCQEKLSEWGEGDPRYQVRVLGNFADSAETRVVPLAHVEAAIARWHDMPLPSGRLELGLDVARFGDDETVVAVRRGWKILEVSARSSMDEHEVAAFAVGIAQRYRTTGEHKPLIKVDACGVGLGVVSILRSTYHEDVNVLGINAADPSISPDDYMNVRSQLWFAVADWLRDGGAIPPDKFLEDDLLSPTYSFDARNRRRVEKKEDIKRRLGRSPDRADAVALAVYAPRAKLVHKHSNVSSSRKVADYRFGGGGRGY